MDDRRSFFRVDDEVSFDYKPVDTHTVEDNQADSLFTDTPSIGLFAEFRAIDSESSQLLHSIGEKDRQISDYLSAINRKVELLAQQVVNLQHGKPKIHVAQINLSEGGIAFNSDKALYKGSFLAMRLVFVPSYVAVAMFAKVIRCEGNKNGHQVAAKFHKITEAQRQIVSKQIMQAQLAHKRRGGAE